MSRTSPKPSTVKKLFAYTGNLCAFPGCQNQMVDQTGTMLGKIAHIKAANPNGPRYDPSMTDEQRRAFDNLIVLCGKHHDIVDDADNLAKFPVATLTRYKKEHEDRFRRAERQFVIDFADHTQATQPAYPSNMRRLYSVLEYGDADDYPEEVPGIAAFIDRLKELPQEQRSFAMLLAQRMRRTGVEALDAYETQAALQISREDLERHMGILEHRGLGSIEEAIEYGRYELTLWDREPGGNPWVEILAFCDATETSTDEFVFELNFQLYDE